MAERERLPDYREMANIVQGTLDIIQDRNRTEEELRFYRGGSG